MVLAAGTALSLVLQPVLVEKKRSMQLLGGGKLAPRDHQGEAGSDGGNAAMSDVCALSL
jgi:hypothetical protein